MRDSDGGKSLGDLIEQLRVVDQQFTVFGSDYHQYEIGPPLTEAEVAEFEHANNVKLPEDYRVFLQTVGNGGAGPFYGLEHLNALHDLARPFILTVPTDELSPKESNQFWENSRSGVIELCHQGCGNYFYLVVNGPTYGTVWQGSEDFYPTGLSFSAWYRQWAERILRTINNVPLLKKLRIGMSKEEVISLVPADWKPRYAPDTDVQFLEATEVPARLVLNSKDRVVAIQPWQFIV